MTPTQRNRLTKKVLGEAFGHGTVRVYQARSPLQEWVNIRINYRPHDAAHHRMLETQVWALLKARRLDRDKVMLHFEPYDGEMLTVRLTGIEDTESGNGHG